MKRPQLVSSGSLLRMLQSAEESWNRKDFEECTKILERASRLAPSNANILFQLGRVYGLRYDYASAESCFERAIRFAARKTEALAQAGQAAIDFADLQLAERYFGQAIEANDVTPEVCIRLAELHERRHQLEQAARLADRALQLDSSYAEALLLRTRLQRQSGHLDEAETVLRLLLPAAKREIRIRAFYELGANLDRQGRCDEAMAAFLEAKALLRLDAPPLLDQMRGIRAHIQEMLDKVSADVFKAWLDSWPQLEPPHRLAFLGGHARSGTTLLEQVLDSHPNVASAEETSIFHDDAYAPLRRLVPEGTPLLGVLDKAPLEALRKSRAKYFRSMELHLGSPIGNRMLIDKNPSINFFIPALVRVFPEIKLLVALRDPRDVCLSCFMQAHVPLSAGSVNYLSLDTTVESYTRVMGLWRKLAPLIRNPSLEVRYEDIVIDLEGVARRVLDFLQVPWDPGVMHFDEHARNKRVRSPTYADVAQPVFRRAMGRWRRYEKYLGPHLDKLAPFINAFGYEP